MQPCLAETAAALIIGNELLSGKVAEQNLVELARTLRTLAVAVTAATLCAMAGASWWRASLWRDPIALWSDAVAKAPGKSRCWNNLGMAHLVAGQTAAALVAFERAVSLDPANEGAKLNAHAARALCGNPCLE